MNPKQPSPVRAEVRSLGQQMYHQEMMIHHARLMLDHLWSQDPIDYLSILAVKEELHDAHHAVHTLRGPHRAAKHALQSELYPPEDAAPKPWN